MLKIIIVSLAIVVMLACFGIVAVKLYDINNTEMPGLEDLDDGIL